MAHKGDDIADRLLALAAFVLRLLPRLETKREARNLARQLERCATSGGANYEEARGAESTADFIHKLRVALKEVRETRYWLKLALKANLVHDPPSVEQTIRETDALIAILIASCRTARRNARPARTGNEKPQF